MVLTQAKQFAKQAENPTALLFAALCHDLGKGLTPAEILPHHYGHEQKGIAPARTLANRLKVSDDEKSLALLVTEYHTHCHKIAELRPETVLKLFNALDVWRRPARFQDFLFACEADARGRLGFEQREYPQAALAKRYWQTALQVDVQAVIADGFEKQAIREELNKRRIKAIRLEKEKGIHA